MKEKIIVGDWSHDGHGISDSYLIEVPNDIDTEGAYQLACRELGFTLDSFCSAYEESEFPVENIERILHCAARYNVPVVFQEFSDLGGAIEENDLESVVEDGNVYITADDYVDMWLTMVNIGIVITKGGTNNTFAYLIPDTQYKTHRIGGYGLYTS